MKAIIELRAGMTATQYRMIHYWVEKQLGKPKYCTQCGTTEDRRYAWANLSGKYLKETTDWRRLCYPCHSKLDTNIHKITSTWRREYCLYGHRQVLTNLYYMRRNNSLECKVCRKTRRYNYKPISAPQEDTEQ